MQGDSLWWLAVSFSFRSKRGLGPFIELSSNLLFYYYNVYVIFVVLLLCLYGFYD